MLVAIRITVQIAGLPGALVTQEIVIEAGEIEIGIETQVVLVVGEVVVEDLLLLMRSRPSGCPGEKTRSLIST